MKFYVAKKQKKQDSTAISLSGEQTISMIRSILTAVTAVSQTLYTMQFV